VTTACLPPTHASSNRAQSPGNTLKREGAGELPWRVPRGSDARLAWKVEVFRAAAFKDERFFDGRHQPCAVQTHPIRIPWRRRNGSVWRYQTLECAYCAASPLTRRACTMPDPAQPPSPPPPPPDACGMGLRASSERLQRQRSPFWGTLPTVLRRATRVGAGKYARIWRVAPDDARSAAAGGDARGAVLRVSRRADAKNDSLAAQAWVAWVLVCRGAAPRLRAPPWVEWRDGGAGGALYVLMEEFDAPLDRWLRRGVA
jgi:hypothetical protein